VFTALRNDLTEISISGGFAPPPGTHPSHTTIFSASADNGQNAAVVWRLDSPVCGALVGADRHLGQVSWPHSGCRTLETTARITLIVAAKSDFDADWNLKPGVSYFVYSQTARAGDGPDTANLPKNVQLQYFGPPPAKGAATTTPTIAAVAEAASGAPTSGGGPAPWVPFVGVLGAATCAALCWRSGLLRR
jgi:hypothetical protein